jgi:hypothetical protein
MHAVYVAMPSVHFFCLRFFRLFLRFARLVASVSSHARIVAMAAEKMVRRFMADFRDYEQRDIAMAGR